jgi:PAS domain S-box-containing protein
MSRDRLTPSTPPDHSESSKATMYLSEEIYQRMIGEIEDYAILMINPDGVILNWNKGAEKIKGYTEAEIIGKNFRIFYPEEDKEAKLPDKLLKEARDNNRATHEGWRVRKDGSKFWGNVVITAIHGNSGEVIGFTKITRDLTERKEAEEDLKRQASEVQRKNKELDAMNQELASFAYVSSHDLQEPLRKIQTFATRIVETEEGRLSDKARDYFGRMQSAAVRMQRLIEDLLTYSRTNTAEKKFETVDLNTVFDEVAHDLKEAIDQRQAVIKVDKLPTLNVIRFQFAQLITNIFSNALKFSKTNVKPVITVTHQLVEGKSIIHMKADKKIKYHQISISDNGIGFEQEHKAKIFEVFQRLHGRSEYEGTGIGLAICKKIVDNHGGIITADGTPDNGATFDIYLPVK